ncbi:M48 family metalloprotease [Halorhabdus salina]|uniref:M48 family metalloprotease n=1 Tax=Halorhabdus salina TaxID=2750670 RepID=UPI0015EF589D|nr:M48 family metalloprotease [Halorhabdus salina]
MNDRGLVVRMAFVSTVLFGFYLLLAWIGLSAGLGLPVIIAGLGVFIGIQYVVGKWSVLYQVGAKPLPRDEFAAFHAEYERISEEMGFDEPPRLLVAEMDAPNAFAVGRKGNGTVVVSPALLELLDFDEAIGVVAHELAHLKNRDSVIMVVGESISSIVGWGVFLLGALSDSLIVSIFAWILGTIAKLFVMIFVLALSRYREFAADRDAARTTGEAQPLAEALRKIDTHIAEHPPENATAAHVSALCIAPQDRGLLATLFSTHPSTDRRVEQLESLSVSSQ